MPKKRDLGLFLTDILEAISRINAYTKGMGYEGFVKDEKTRDAVVRNLEIIGEAAKNLPDDIKGGYPKVNWKAITGMRDKLTHEYFGVSVEILWETVKNDLPPFESQIRMIAREIKS